MGKATTGMYPFIRIFSCFKFGYFPFFHISEVISERSGAALSRNPKLWVLQLGEFLRSDRRALSELARDRAEEFPWEKCGENLLELYGAAA